VAAGDGLRFLTGVTGTLAQQLRREWAAERGREKQEEVEARPKPTHVLVCGLLLTLCLFPVRASAAPEQAPVTIRRPVDPGYAPRLRSLQRRLALLKARDTAAFQEAARQPEWEAARTLVQDLTENDCERLARGVGLEWPVAKLSGAKQAAVLAWQRTLPRGARVTDASGARVFFTGDRVAWVYLFLEPAGDHPGEVELGVQLSTARRWHSRMQIGPFGPVCRVLYGPAVKAEYQRFQQLRRRQPRP
jgi:hypothetical protein